jgi:hypothetical protein
LDNVRAVGDEWQTIPSRASPDFKYLETPDCANTQEVADDTVRIRVHFVDVFLFLPKRLPVLTSGFSLPNGRDL